MTPSAIRVAWVVALLLALALPHHSLAQRPTFTTTDVRQNPDDIQQREDSLGHGYHGSVRAAYYLGMAIALVNGQYEVRRDPDGTIDVSLDTRRVKRTMLRVIAREDRDEDGLVDWRAYKLVELPRQALQAADTNKNRRIEDEEATSLAESKLQQLFARLSAR